jgi:hypothetical protein
MFSVRCMHTIIRSNSSDAASQSRILSRRIKSILGELQKKERALLSNSEQASYFLLHRIVAVHKGIALVNWMTYVKVKLLFVCTHLYIYI